MRQTATKEEEPCIFHRRRLQAMEVRLGDSDRRIDFSARELTHVETSFVHREDCLNS